MMISRLFISSLALAATLLGCGTLRAQETATPKNTDLTTATTALIKKAIEGDASAQWRLGFMYANEIGVVKDEVEAVKWYRKGADQGDAMAQLFLGRMYENGNGVVKDEVEAVKWYRKAADQGDARAQVFLGYMYENGKGTVKDEVTAYKWYLLAGAQGEEFAKEKIPLIEQGLAATQRLDGQKLAGEFKKK